LWRRAGRDQALDSSPDTRDRLLAVGELPNRDHTSKAVPNIHEPGHRPIVGELSQSVFARKMLNSLYSLVGASAFVAYAVMLFSGSIVNVIMILLSFRMTFHCGDDIHYWVRATQSCILKSFSRPVSGLLRQSAVWIDSGKAIGSTSTFAMRPPSLAAPATKNR
jgi:hypothetical protein